MTPDTPPPRRLLLIRPSALGDVARTVPALATLRAAFPQAHIDWLVQDTYADLVAHHPDLTGVVRFARRDLARWFLSPAGVGRWRGFTTGLRAAGYDAAYDLQGLFRSGYLAWRTGAGVRVGFANARELAWGFYNRRHFVDPGRHTVDRMLELLQAEGLPPAPRMRLHLGAEQAGWLARFLDDHGWTDRPYTVLAPTAQWPCKCWPLEGYARIARRLLDRGAGGGRIVVLAAEHERGSLGPLLEAAGGDRGGPVLFPATSVGQMMALISACRLLVGNDSGALHVGVGFDRPLVSIFGPTDPALVGPYRRPETVVQPPGIQPHDMQRYRHRRLDQSLIARVSVEAVWAKIEEQLAGGERI